MELITLFVRDISEIFLVKWWAGEKDVFQMIVWRFFSASGGDPLGVNF